MKSKQVLLLARPDHSYLIYSSLLRTKIAFQYVSFKLFPKWLVKLLHYKRLRSVERNASINHYLSLYRTLRSNIKVRGLSEKTELKIFNKFAMGKLNKFSPQLIHYWPIYCGRAVSDYKLQHPEVLTFAEIYFPCPKYVINKIGDLLASYGLEKNLDYIKRDDIIFDEITKYESNFIVPSSYVAKTYAKYYPNANFFVIPYGITPSSIFKRKQISKCLHYNFRFVFVGTISLEKGCDVLCEYFSLHPEYELHLYGAVIASEQHLFDKYLGLKNIIFHGTIAKNLVQIEVAKFDIGIHLSRFDAYSLAVGELIGAGLPVIVSSDTGNCEDIMKYQWGVVTELDSNQLDNSIKHLCSIENYNKYADNIYNYIKSSPRSYGELVVDFYKQYLKNE